MYLDDVQLNAQIDLPPVVLSKDEIVEFARKYDPLPMHYDEEYAKTTHFGGLFSPGILSMLKVWAQFVEMQVFGEGMIAGKSAKIEWIKPVFPEDTLSGRITFTNVTRRNPYNGIVEILMEVFNQNGDLVLTHLTESVVKYRNGS